MLAALPVFFASPAFAQHAGHGPQQQQQPSAQPRAPSVEDHSAHQQQAEPQAAPTPQEEAPAMEMMWPTTPPVGNEAPPPPPGDWAADRVFDPAVMEAARAQQRREHGASIVSQVMLHLFEHQVGEDDGGYRWEGEAWIGGDIHRFVLKTEGEGNEDDLESGEVQALYSRAIAPFFDLQAGVRYDFEPTPNRTYAVLGVEGVAPYWFELDAALFLSDRGELQARAEGSYDLRLTQRLILEPRAELTFAAEDIPEIGVGSGLSEGEYGLRLRYEIQRNFAPYIGVTLDQKYGQAADFAEAAGEDPSEARVVIGLRAWF